MRYRRQAAVPLMVALIAATTATAQQRPIEIDDLFAIARVSSPEISPDGSRVVYAVGGMDLEEDSSQTSLWMSATDPGAQPLRLTGPDYSASSPRFSPSGQKLAFLSSRKTSTKNEDSKSQVWAFDLRGGDAQPLTTIEQGVDSFEWSPDGERLLLVLRDPEEEQDSEAEEGEEPSSKKPKKEGPKPHVIDRLQFKRDYRGYLDRRRTHLYLFDLESEQLQQLTDGDYDDGSPRFNPDGTQVVFTSNRSAEPDANDNSDLWLIEVPEQLATASDDQRETAALAEPTQLTFNVGSDGSPAWSPDGRTIAYITHTQPELIWYEVAKLAVIDADGGKPRVLTTELDRNVSRPRFAADGTLLLVLEDSGAEQLVSIDTDSGDLRRLTPDDRSLGTFSVSKEGSVALLASEPHRPTEVFVYEAGKLQQLSRVNDELIAELDLGEVLNVQFPSADGTEIEGFLTLPPDYVAGQRYPTLLRIHGGPVSQYDFGFHFESQLFAAHGYVVVRANPRGSSGYGQEFSRAIWANWGNKDFEDVMAAVDHAIAQGYADPEHLGVGGWSYGGILTNYVITQTSRFHGAISGASEVLYIANYGHDHYQRQWEAELGLPWENREAWERISPFNKVDRVSTPTLLIGGALDWNVPILNSEQMYQALKRRGIDTQLVVYPGEHHGIRRPSFQKDRYQRYLEWYDRYVKGNGEAAPVSP